ncbi:helix-turn-helix transcriptional regulator [Streptomyces griseorubiginosus]|uniref:helix-turn-helix transcriptional regulator n=1 Tax=Streptomyces griseorubiginosus TaxID=67304 RepID=UPI0036AAB39E
MPVRRFDPQALLLARRECGRKQAEVGELVGVSGARVSAWEKGRSVPDPEKLPGLAMAVFRDLDELFPRDGRPDLADLRADAGYTQAATKELTGTKTAGPVAAAETAKHRLEGRYVEALAANYGVSVEALLRAQERSFGIDVPEPGEAPAPVQQGGEGLPETLAEKIAYLVEQLPAPLSDAELAELGNARTGTETLTTELVRDLRTGAVSSAGDDVLDALAKALNTSPLIWSQDADVQRVIAETLLLKHQIVALAARGGEQQGLSAELLRFVFDVVDEARAETQGGEGAVPR